VATLHRYQRRAGLTVTDIAWPATLVHLRIWAGPPRAVLVGGDTVRSLAPLQVALTFDDGPSIYTDDVLDVLARYDVPATFFPVGSAVGANARVLRRAVRQGNSVQNHTWDHAALTKLSDSSVYNELERTSDVVQSATGVRPSCYRPPYGATSARVRAVARAARLYPEMFWTEDTSDYRGPPPSTIIGRALASADGRGLIILFHDGGGNRSNTVAALPGVISGLQSRGYNFVSLGNSFTGPVDATPT
jgi:peptidoglycan/xylan/chitin deacetylase (PgdA/CDA1 family)